MHSTIEKELERKLNRRIVQQTYRQLPKESQRLDFSSNDYLGFARDGLLDIGNESSVLSGSRASRLIAGNSALHESVEKMVAAYHHADTGLIFNSGYDANVGLMGCIAQKNDVILYDELCHASIRDGMKMSLAKCIPFKHNDMDDLKRLLKETPNHVFVVTEGLFSMDGDVAPLLDIIRCCKTYHAAIIIDEAHSNGVIGTQGKGLVCELGVEQEIFARVHTFGKAMGCHGAIIMGSEILRNYLINYARSFIFTTAIPPHSLLLIQKAYEVLAKTARVQELQENIQLFRNSLKPSVLEKFILSQSPIQSIVIKGAEATRKIAKIIQESGFEVKPIVAPTVPLGLERIRICIHASHQKKEIVALCQILNEFAN